ncbi:MAG: hypothetical protein M1828_007112 [Chrysothrix sp. TS-e1954]|nr:MAG: hypothetical protein M1828_007112 [Chrysothrix sp. TS-e1954]
MKVFSHTHEFDYTWDEVSTANWRKYCPWNHESSHVVAVDTLSRNLDTSTGILRTERLITTRQPAPKWLSPILGKVDLSHSYEVSYVRPGRAAPIEKSTEPLHLSDALSSPPHGQAELVTDLPPIKPLVTMTSYNLTFSDLISVRETVTYTPSTDDPTHRTHFEQQARITAMCGGWKKVRERIEAFTVERFGQNAERGRAGFEEVLEMSRRAFGQEREREAALKTQAS